MEEESLKKRAVKGGIWSGIEQFSNKFIQLVFTIILARMLTPEDYGVVALTIVFFSIAFVLIDSGFATALIRKPDKNDKDLSTCFFFNITVAVVVYVFLFWGAPLIAVFYSQPVLVPVIRVSGIALIIKSLYIVQDAQFQYNVDFKSLAKISLTSSVLSGIIGVIMAYWGLGVWSLVLQNISQNIITLSMQWVISKWRPMLVFSRESFRYLINFGSKLTFSYLIGVIYENLSSVVIGKFYHSSQLGFYNRAETIGRMPAANITALLQRVSFPIFSIIQDDNERLSLNFRRCIRLSVFFCFPVMLGLSALATPIIRLLLTEKWDGCIYYLQIMCFSFMFYPIHALNLNLLQVKGRSDLFLKLEIYKKMLGISILVITAPIGIVAMCYGMVLSGIICLFINTYYSRHLIGTGFKMQFVDILPCLVNSIVMYLIVHFVISFFDNELFSLFVGGFSAVVSYVIGANILSKKEIKEIKYFFYDKKNNNC